MSKAFTSEETPDAETVSRMPARLEPGQKRYVTPEGHRALVAQLERAAAERAELASQPPAQSAALGNGARLAELEQRARALAATLSTLTVAPPPASTDRALFGAWVSLEDEDGQLSRYRLVGPDEAEAKSGLLSVESPLARAILGKRAGDEVTVELPRGTAEFTLREVRYTEL